MDPLQDISEMASDFKSFVASAVGLEVLAADHGCTMRNMG